MKRPGTIVTAARSYAVTFSGAAPTGAPQSGLHGLSGIKVHDDDALDPAKLRRPGKRLTSPERWEVNQLIKSGVLSVSEYPTFDEEGQVRSFLRFHDG